MGYCPWMREDVRWEEQRAKASASSPWRSPAGSQLALCAILVSSRVPDDFLKWWWWCEVSPRAKLFHLLLLMTLGSGCWAARHAGSMGCPKLRKIWDLPSNPQGSCWVGSRNQHPKGAFTGSAGGEAAGGES